MGYHSRNFSHLFANGDAQLGREIILHCLIVHKFIVYILIIHKLIVQKLIMHIAVVHMLIYKKFST